jgi:hypothetical protein
MTSGNRLFVLTFMASLAMVVLSAQGERPAAGYWECRTFAPDGTLYVTPVWELTAAWDDVNRAWTQFLAAKYGYKRNAFCSRANIPSPKTLADLKAEQDRYLDQVRNSGMPIVQTGWTYSSASPSAAAATPAPAPSPTPASPRLPPPAGLPAAAQTQTAAQATSVSGNIDIRVLEPVDSARDGSGKQFRGTVAQRVIAGNLTIPQNALANLTLSEAGGTWTVTLNSIVLSGQPLAVTSGPPTVQGDGGVGRLLGRLGLPSAVPVMPGGTPLASGARVSLFPGTTVRFPFSATTSLAAIASSPAPRPVPSPAPGAGPSPGAGPATGPGAGSAPGGAIAAASVKETLLGPAKQAGMFIVSPDGGHYAVLSNKGSREVIIIDGVEGPEFDRAAHSPGGVVGVIDVTFSIDGTHSAYLGQRGDSLIAVVDGKEAFTVTSVNQAVRGGVPGIDQTWIHDRGAGRQIARQFLVSPGGRVAVVSMESVSGLSYYMFLDGAKSPAYRQIDLKQVAFVGEKLVYAAMTADQQWHVVENNKPGPAVGAIRSLNLSDNDQHYAYIATSGTSSTVVVDGVPGTPRAVSTFGIGHDLEIASNGRVAYLVDTPTGAGGKGMTQALYVDDKLVHSDVRPFASSYATTAQYRSVNIAIFSPDGRKFAYARPVPGGMAAVIDGKQGIAYDGIGVMGFSPDSRRSFFVGLKNVTGSYVVIDGQEMPVQNNLKEFTFSRDGSRFGYLGSTVQDGNVIVIDGKPIGGKVFTPVDRALAFSADGKHIVYGSCSFYNQCQLVRDGTATNIPQLGNFIMRATPPISFPPVLFSPDGTRLAYTHSSAVFVDGQEFGRAPGFSFRAFSPDSKHFAALGRTSQGSMLFVDGKAGPSYQDVLEANLNAMVWTDARTVRVLAVKGGSVYRVTVDAGN